MSKSFNIEKMYELGLMDMWRYSPHFILPFYLHTSTIIIFDCQAIEINLSGLETSADLLAKTADKFHEVSNPNLCGVANSHVLEGIKYPARHPSWSLPHQLRERKTASINQSTDQRTSQGNFFTACSNTAQQPKSSMRLCSYKPDKSKYRPG